MSSLDFTDYEQIPLSTQDALVNYVDHGLIPGGFLKAVLSNDLFKAVGRADASNRATLPLIVQFVYNRCPMDCWGSSEAVEKYAERKHADI